MAIIRRIQPSRFPGMLPSDSKYKDAKEVHNAARGNGIKTRPFDIEKFIKMHNIEVVREEMADNDISGYIECRSGQWVIGINMYHSVNRQRFTLAHEFAHFCLDKQSILDSGKYVETILFRDRNSNPRERTANEFASQILMPDDLFKKFIKERTKNIVELAELFGVSPAAIRYKAYKLGFIREY